MITALLCQRDPPPPYCPIYLSIYMSVLCGSTASCTSAAIGKLQTINCPKTKLSKNYRLLTPTSCRCLTLAVDNFGTVNSYHLPSLTNICIACLFPWYWYWAPMPLISAFHRGIKEMRLICYSIPIFSNRRTNFTYLMSKKLLPLQPLISPRLKPYNASVF